MKKYGYGQLFYPALPWPAATITTSSFKTTQAQFLLKSASFIAMHSRLRIIR